MGVAIRNRQRRLRLDLKALRRRTEAILHALRSGDEDVSVAFVSSRAMRPLNRQYRGIDETTDVLAFPPAKDFEMALSGAGEGQPGRDTRQRFLGDVVISVEEALHQAEEDATTFEEAIDRLLIHGILHLKGYDHGTAPEASRMRRKERQLQSALKKASK